MKIEFTKEWCLHMAQLEANHGADFVPGASEAQETANVQFAHAVSALAEAGPLKIAKVVCLRVPTETGYAMVNAAIFSESVALAETMVSRLMTPSVGELAIGHSTSGVTPHPSVP